MDTDRFSFIIKCAAGVVIAAAAACLGLRLYNGYRAEKAEIRALTIEQERESRQESVEGLDLIIESHEPESGSMGFISAYDVANGSADGEIILDCSYLPDNADLMSDRNNELSVATLTFSDITADADDLMVLQFEAYTMESTVNMEVGIDARTVKLFLTRTPTVYYIPITDEARLESITFSVTGEYYPTVIDRFSLVNYGKSVSIDRLMTGAWRKDERITTQLTTADQEAPASMQVLAKDSYLYALSGSSLICYKVDESVYESVNAGDSGTADGTAEGEPAAGGSGAVSAAEGHSVNQQGTGYGTGSSSGGRDGRTGGQSGYGESEIIAVIESGTQEEHAAILTEASVLGGLGEGVRDMAMTEDEQAIVIAAGLNGAYIADISDPYNIQLVSHYDTLESAKGITVSGNRAYIASRYSGIEIVDITDISAPLFINKAALGDEYTDCCIDGGRIYAAATGKCRVDIYEISDDGECTLTEQIETDGAPGGLAVRNGMLYVATGRNSSYNEAKELWQFGTGTGNGLELYDVSDPDSPVHVSTVKTNGRMSYTSCDIWDVQAEDGYAYVTDMANGLLVYDVRDAENPVCAEEFTIAMPVTDGKYDLTAQVLSWDTTENDRGAASHIAADNGVIWLCSQDAGIYAVRTQLAANGRAGGLQTGAQAGNRAAGGLSGGDISGGPSASASYAGLGSGTSGGGALSREPGGNASGGESAGTGNNAARGDIQSTGNSSVQRDIQPTGNSAAQRDIQPEDIAAGGDGTSGAQSIRGSRVLREEPESLGLNEFTASVFETDGAVWAAVSYEGRIYAACGEDGIRVLDMELGLTDTVECRASVRDIRIKDGILYTAESDRGIGIYRLPESADTGTANEGAADAGIAGEGIAQSGDEDGQGTGETSVGGTAVSAPDPYGVSRGSAASESGQYSGSGGDSEYVSGPGITRIGYYETDPELYCITQLALTADGRYLIAQASLTKYIVLDVSDPASPAIPEGYEETETGSYYYKNMVAGLVNGSYAGIAGSGRIDWFASGSSDGNLIMKSTRNPHYSEGGGLVLCGDRLVQAAGNAYYYYYFEDLDKSENETRVKLNGLSSRTRLNAGVSGAGNVLVATSMASGSVMIVDVSDIDAPEITEQFTVRGNPDTAEVNEDYILVPLRYGGLLKLDRTRE